MWMFRMLAAVEKRLLVYKTQEKIISLLYNDILSLHFAVQVYSSIYIYIYIYIKYPTIVQLHDLFILKLL